MSRHDLDGVFWQDAPRISRNNKDAIRPIPATPDTGWHPPRDFPNLGAAKRIAIDCETYDPDLLSLGPGVRRTGEIVGLAVGTDDGGRWYFPMRHRVDSHLNLSPEGVLSWARDNLCRGNQPKVGANLLYDLDYLYHSGVEVTGPFYDVQVAEPLIDETARSYSLENIARKYLGQGKESPELYQWAAKAYGGEANGRQRANIYRCPPALVGPYAESDVDLPLLVFDKQQQAIASEGLESVFQMETGLIPMLLAMRQRGVRVDVEGAHRAYDLLSGKIKAGERLLKGINVNAGDDLARYCKKNGIPIRMTAPTDANPRGRPSFTKDWLKVQTDPVLIAVREVRQLMKMRDTFIKGYVLDAHVNGRVHGQFNQLKSDEGGTVSGRFSSSDPNLQNLPAGDVYKPMIRGLFLPDEDERWVRNDWSQIEFRFLTHYARGEGAATARMMYRDDPTTDFHTMTAQLTQIDRKPAKNINFGLVYGMGEKKMAAGLGRSLEDVKEMFDTYHGRLPFVRHTYNFVGELAGTRGWIRTYAGRRRRFNLWEPTGYRSSDGDRPVALPFDVARHKWGARIRRAYTHKSLNALLQGSAADAMKLAMVKLWEDGYCAPGVFGAPLLTVHDELDWSIRPDRLHMFKEVKQVLETCIQLRVPVVADCEIGNNWGHLEDFTP